MNRYSLRSLLLLVMAAALIAGTVSHQYRRHIRARYVPLDAAVAAFNSLAARDSIGKSQRPVSSAEVLTAIRSQLPTVAKQDAAAEAVFKRILATQEMPRNARLHSITTWTTAAKSKPVWWVNLDVSTDDLSGLGYGLRIRENNDLAGDR